MSKNGKERSDTSWLPYMEKTRNYNRWVFSQYREHIGREVLDIGSGLGTFVDFIKDKKSVCLLEVSAHAIERLKKRFKYYRNIRVIKGDLSRRPEIEGLGKKKFDTIICLNTLEHVKNDRAMIKNIRSRLKPGGKLVLYVPALKALFGTLDKNLGHHRRYDKSEIEALLEDNKFSIIKSRHMNILGVISWFVYSRLLKRKAIKEKRLLFYDKLLIPALSIIEGVIPAPLGQSLILIARAS